MVQNNSKHPPKRSRGRPRAYDPGAALANAAAKFWTAGFSATSLDDLSAATGMNRPSLYNAFGDKHALYLQSLGEYRAQARRGMAKALAPERALRDGLTEVYRRALDTYFSGEDGARGCMMLGTAAVEAVSDAGIRDSLHAGLTEIDEAFRKRFRLARQGGEIAADSDPVFLARMASAVMYMMAMRARAGEKRGVLESFAAQSVAFICGAIAPAKRR